MKEEVVDPGGLALTTKYETDARGNVTKVIDARGIAHEVDYNVLDWQLALHQATTGLGGDIGPLNYRTEWSYDANGNVSEVREPFGAGTEHTATRLRYGVLDEPLETRSEVEPGGDEMVSLTIPDAKDVESGVEITWHQ